VFGLAEKIRLCSLTLNKVNLRMEYLEVSIERVPLQSLLMTKDAPTLELLMVRSKFGRAKMVKPTLNYTANLQSLLSVGLKEFLSQEAKVEISIFLILVLKNSSHLLIVVLSQELLISWKVC
jgi:hypothetical protein